MGQHLFAVNGDGWRSVQEERPPALDDWSARHLDRLATLEEQALAAVAGDTLLHFDIRADNLLLTPERVVVVDWPHARIGARFGKNVAAPRKVPELDQDVPNR